VQLPVTDMLEPGYVVVQDVCSEPVTARMVAEEASNPDGASASLSPCEPR
jgi:hypothetical protein